MSTSMTTLFMLLLCVSFVFSVQERKFLTDAEKEQLLAKGDFGVLPKNFFHNTSAPLDTLDVAAALEQWASSFCAPGGGYSEYGTGPFCMNNCHNCPCNKMPDGSYTWCGYPQQCMGYMWGLQNLVYGNYTTKPGTPFTISETFTNQLNVSQQFSFSKTASYSNTYSWTFSTTISDSMSVSVTASIPEVCSVTDTFSTSISLTTSNTQTHENTNSWTVSQTFTVPPNSAVIATMVIGTAQFNMPYTANIRFQGAGYAWCQNQVEGHWCWFPWASNFLNMGGCSSDDGSDAICPFAGAFYGLQGVQATVTIKPLTKSKNMK